jgi:arylsulfatase
VATPAQLFVVPEVGMASRPNIILITTDQQRYDTLGVTGNPHMRTPHFDALAGRGTLFERAYVQNPVYIPSRACLQTGRYTHQHGVHYMDEVVDATPGLPAWEITFMERLQAAGYRTGATGKIHMLPPKGFHYERLCGGKGFRWTQAEGLPIGPGPLGPTYASWLEARHPGAYEMIYEQRRQADYWRYMTAIRNVLPLEEYVESWILEESLEFLSYPGPRPFFLWCGLCGPHAPIDPPAPYDRAYAPDALPRPRSRADTPPRSPKGQAHGWWGDDLSKILRWRAYYAGLVTLLDDMIGRIVAWLERSQRVQDTLLIVTSDHGDMAGDYNLMEKGNFYEEVIHVPLIVVPPGGAGRRQRLGGLVEVADLAPTILDYAGVPIPPQMPTHSLRPMIEGSGPGRASILCEYTANDRARQGKCVRSERYKYIFWGAGRAAEFYDLQEDPDEQINRAGDPAYQGELQAHQELLLERLCQSEQTYERDETPSARELRAWL